jgi:DNA-binding transcriptional regulator LsrR (DeoR family)
MNDLTLNTTGAVEATLVTPATVELNAVEKLLFASRAIAGSIKKVEAADESTSGTGDFDAASRAFKAGNNKLDRLIDTRESMLSGAKAGVKAIRDLLDAVSDQLRALED